MSMRKSLYGRSSFDASCTSFLQLEGTGLVGEGRFKIMARNIVTNESRRATCLCASLAQNCMTLCEDVSAHVAHMQAIISNPSLAKPDEFDCDGGRS